MNGWTALKALFAGLLITLAPSASAEMFLAPRPEVKTPRIYVIDCGTITNAYPERFGLAREEVGNMIMADMCFLIVHPKGTLIWDTGLPDSIAGRPLGENRTTNHVAYLKMNTLVGQLADIGYTPEMIDFVSHSHHHHDHTGNSNLFARTATWLVSKPECHVMFGSNERQRGYENNWMLKDAKTIFVDENHDVFGDGTVVIKQAAGHTPGHSVLQVKLKNTGPVILAGDLYHYPEEMTLNRMPKAEETSGTREARAMVINLAKQLKGQIWIAHDFDLFQRIPREPAYND